MATLAICIVFFPVVLLVGPARFLFTPLALAVVFAMLASYLLSRTLVPTLARMLDGVTSTTASRGADASALDALAPGASTQCARSRLRALPALLRRVLEHLLHHRLFTLIVALLVGVIRSAWSFVVGHRLLPDGRRRPS